MIFSHPTCTYGIIVNYTKAVDSQPQLVKLFLANGKKTAGEWQIQSAVWVANQSAQKTLTIDLVHTKYLSLTEFEVHTVSYGPSFFLLIYGPSAKHMGHKWTEKKRSVTYSTARENEVGKIFTVSLRLIGRTGKETFELSRPYSEIRPPKLTNHTVHTERE